MRCLFLCATALLLAFPVWAIDPIETLFPVEGTPETFVGGAPTGCADCPEGALLEGEPDCYQGYFDLYNGGCTSAGWTLIDDCHQDVCGRSGTFVLGDLQYRDTDWYEIWGRGDTVTVACTADFAVQLLLIYQADCDDLAYEYMRMPVCEEAVVRHVIEDGAVAWIWVGPSPFAGLIPCGTPYKMHVTGHGTPPQGGSGACCLPDGTCKPAAGPDGCPASGEWFPCAVCDPSPCAPPVPAGEETWGSIKLRYR